MSTITRFAVRSSGRDLTLVRRPLRDAVVVAPAKVVSGPETNDADVETLGVSVGVAKPAKSTKKSSK